MDSMTLAYFWTEMVPEQKRVADMINGSRYSQVISTFSVDNGDIRNRIRFGKFPQASVPFFLVQENSKTTAYPPNQAGKVFTLAERLLTMFPIEKSKMTTGFDDLTDISTKSGSSVSRVETDDERDLPSILESH